MKLKPVSKPKRPRLLGPGTVLAVCAAIGIFVYGRPGERTPQNSTIGRIAFEADAQGRMRPVESTTPPQVTPLPLLKPEVGLLLLHASDLRLGSRQKQQVDALNAAWKREKADLEATMHRSLSAADQWRKDAEAHRSASAGQITTSLGDYSRLSHLFNERRTFYWMQAQAVLMPEQRTTLERIMSTNGRRGTE